VKILKQQKAIRRMMTMGNRLFPGDLKKTPIHITICGATCPCSYCLLFMIAQGKMFGKHQPVTLTLMDVENRIQRLKGIVMELEDSSFPLVTDFK